MPFTRPHIPTDSDLDAIEGVTHMLLSDSVRTAYMRLAGHHASGIGAAYAIQYPDGTASDDLLQRFLLEADIREQWLHIGYLSEFVAHFELGPDFVDPDVLLPFADCADGGIYLANSGRHAGKVYHADNGDFGIALIASRLTDFEALFDFTAA